MLTASLQGELLREALAACGGAVCPTDIARWSGFTPRSAQRWVAGEALMPLSAFIALMERCPVRLLIDTLSDMVIRRGDRLTVFVSDLAASDLGVDRTADAHGTDALRRIADLLDASAEARRDGRITESESAGLRAHLHAAMRCLARMEWALNTPTEHRRPAMCVQPDRAGSALSCTRTSPQ